jgi:polar amino acid transport system substrate-binding protein
MHFWGLQRRQLPNLPGRRSGAGPLSGKLLLLHLFIFALSATGSAFAQTPATKGQSPAPAPQAPPQVQAPQGSAVTVPSFWDPRRRPDRPDTSRIALVRFATEVNYPPFDFAGSDGNPAGFNVDLARMMCDELKVPCTMQMRRFDTLIDSLNDNRADAVIASIAVTPETRQRVDFSDPYYRPAARFVGRRQPDSGDRFPEHLEGKKIAVVGGTAQEEYARTLFTEADIKRYDTLDAARDALKKGEVDLLFADAFGSAFWLNGTDSGNCCKFVGGPVLESRLFGEGVGVAVKRGNDTLRNAFNWALFRLWENGKFAELWLRYFPVSPY